MTGKDGYDGDGYGKCYRLRQMRYQIASIQGSLLCTVQTLIIFLFLTHSDNSFSIALFCA